MFDAFQIGPFMVWTHVIFLMLGIWLATEFFLRLAQSAHFPLQQFLEWRWWYVGAFAIGGRTIAMLTEYRVYLRHPLQLFVVWDGNFSFLGGVIGVGCVVWYANRLSRATFLQWLDVLLPAATFGLIFDWMGRFFAGQHYGSPTDMFWGVTYDAMQVRYAVPIHPVQLYYALFYAMLTFLLLIVRKHAKRAGGETLVGIVLASVGVMILESFRGDFAIPVFATTFDFILLVLLFAGLGLFALLEVRMHQRGVIAYELVMAVVFGGYLLLRPMLPLETMEMRFSQLLAVLALLATVVYVVVHRRWYPHL
ncbi:MAG: phosphatidylglycerol:prolipoprotein diacylglycerol transferase [Candidatus Peregrinibacteria bacterium Gr01-1014_25]|nr:MAG: phosphatidylglycerol:prolipoprotein diacylglycerol transferase [Candidatus Peregrinibacteria bacterium Gr01-1014_25]